MQQTDKEVVSAIAHGIVTQIGQQCYDLWFQSNTRLEFADNVLTVWVPNGFFQEWLQTNFRSIVARAAGGVVKHRVAIRFDVDKGLRGQCTPQPAPIPAPPAPPGASDTDTPADRLPGLEEFVPGACNRLAYAAAQKACESPGGQFSPLFLYGAVGLGKTHLLEGIFRRMQRRPQRRLRVVLLSAEEFTNHFISALRGGSLPSFRKKYRGVDTLLLDDVQFFSAKKATQDEFLHTLKFLEGRNRQVVLTADRHPRLIQWTSRELATRLVAGMVCPLESPDRETRLSILKAKCERREPPISTDVLEYLADHVVSSVRELEGALNTLHAYRELMQVCLNLDTARQVVGSCFPPSERMVRLGDVEQAVCSVFGVNADDLKSSRRSRQLSQPRMLAMYLARKHTRAACSEIGSYFGGRNYTTVVSAQKKVRDWLTNNRALQLRDCNWHVKEVVQVLERQLLAS